MIIRIIVWECDECRKVESQTSETFVYSDDVVRPPAGWSAFPKTLCLECITDALREVSDKIKEKEEG